MGVHGWLLSLRDNHLFTGPRATTAVHLGFAVLVGPADDGGEGRGAAGLETTFSSFDGPLDRAARALVRALARHKP